MATASGLASPPSSCIRRRNLISCRVSASVAFFAKRSARRSAMWCCYGGVEDDVLGSTSSSKPRLPRLVGMGSKLIGCGSAVPKLVVSNDDLAQIVDTSDEWISVRTGIRNRRVLAGDETLSGLAVMAAREALQMAELGAHDVDLVILCTSTPDDLFGGGGKIQRDLGCRNAWAFDITAACSGFIVGLITATRFMKGGGYKNILVLGADALSRYVDWTDRGTCILFGDAAGAVLVQACSADEDGLLGFDLHSDGSGQRHLNAMAVESEADVLSNMNGAPVFLPRKTSYACLQMNGKEVFRFAARCVPQSIETALEEAGLACSSIDWLLLHQANQRIIDAVASRLQVPSEKVISNLANYGNTSAASIPLALDEAVRAGKVKAGDLIAASGFGAGLTWGSAIVRFRSRRRESLFSFIQASKISGSKFAQPPLWERSVPIQQVYIRTCLIRGIFFTQYKFQL
ncbi:3-oxoacyl-[acyl-carrier-protein] synthase III, chloroplastic [Apostasia shenzhenica]|uniref:beta-ketoacyl-[acyl-carrier-protein] synthase III n=1 Tax=Apostasia shenzhenica TaxID=1088818 RepID=A0A2H9ZV23_9ASPA|nr:3-oxoacyl-[acyl-carrier-protein] synthase III, chloroplastic [Apostasia shenzhenica]